jgi:hypothetical protein
VFVVAYFSYRAGADVSENAPARLLLLPWPRLRGVPAHLPTYFADTGAGWTTWWGQRQADLGIDPGNGWSASLVSLVVAAVLTAVVCLPAIARGRARTATG